MKRLAALFLFLAALSAFGQPVGTPVKLIYGKKIANLPQPSNATNEYWVIFDGAGVTDCTTGGGSSQVICYSNGSTWATAAPGGGTGTVSGQATGVIPLASGTNIIGAQSGLSDNGTTVTSTEPVTVSSSGASTITVGTSGSSGTVVLNDTGGTSSATLGVTSSGGYLTDNTGSQTIGIFGPNGSSTNTLARPVTVTGSHTETSSQLYIDGSVESGSDFCQKWLAALNDAIAVNATGRTTIDMRNFYTSQNCGTDPFSTLPSSGEFNVTTLMPGVGITATVQPSAIKVNDFVIKGQGQGGNSVWQAGSSYPTNIAQTGDISITAWSITSNVATFTATQSLVAGQVVFIRGFGTSTFFNGLPYGVIATGLSGSQFEVNVNHADGSATESGTAHVETPLFTFGNCSTFPNLFYSRIETYRLSANGNNLGAQLIQCAMQEGADPRDLSIIGDNDSANTGDTDICIGCANIKFERFNVSDSGANCYLSFSGNGTGSYQGVYLDRITMNDTGFSNAGVGGICFNGTKFLSSASFNFVHEEGADTGMRNGNNVQLTGTHLDTTGVKTTNTLVNLSCGQVNISGIADSANNSGQNLVNDQCQSPARNITTAQNAYGSHSAISGYNSQSGVAAATPFVYVTQYGAKCDGSTNDQTAFISATDVIGAAGQGTLVLPSGKTCRVSGFIPLISNETVASFNTYGSIIKLTNAANAPIFYSASYVSAGTYNVIAGYSNAASTSWSVTAGTITINGTFSANQFYPGLPVIFTSPTLASAALQGCWIVTASTSAITCKTTQTGSATEAGTIYTLTNRGAAANSGSSTSITGWALRGITIDGNSANQSTFGINLWVYGNLYHLDHIVSQNAYSQCMNRDFSATPGSTDFTYQDVAVNTNTCGIAANLSTIYTTNAPGNEIDGPTDGQIIEGDFSRSSGPPLWIGHNAGNTQISASHEWYPNAASSNPTVFVDTGTPAGSDHLIEGSAGSDIVFMQGNGVWTGGRCFENTATGSTCVQIGQASGVNPFPGTFFQSVPGSLNPAANSSTSAAASQLDIEGLEIAFGEASPANTGINIANGTANTIKARVNFSGASPTGSAKYINGTIDSASSVDIDGTGLTCAYSFATCGVITFGTKLIGGGTYPFYNPVDSNLNLNLSSGVSARQVTAINFQTGATGSAVTDWSIIDDGSGNASLKDVRNNLQFLLALAGSHFDINAGGTGYIKLNADNSSASGVLFYGGGSQQGSMDKFGNFTANNGFVSSATLKTATNCASGASPAVCGSSAAGAVAMPTGTNPTLVVQSTAVTANSEIFLTVDDTLSIGGTTCNSTLATLVGGVAVTARTASTSFTISYSGTIAVNPVCLSYRIVN